MGKARAKAVSIAAKAATMPENVQSHRRAKAKARVRPTTGYAITSGYTGKSGWSQPWPATGAIKSLCALKTIAEKDCTDNGGFPKPTKTVRPDAQISLLAVRKATFLSKPFETQVPPSAALGGGSQGSGKDCVC